MKEEPINFSVLLLDPVNRSYKESLQLQEIIHHYPREAIEWLRKNSAIVAKAYQYAEKEVKPDVDLAALLIIVSVLVRAEREYQWNLLSTAN